MPIIGPTDYVHPSPNYQLNSLHQAMGYNSSGEPSVRTSVSAVGLDIASGQVHGTSSFFKAGYNPSFANNSEQSYWGRPALYPWSAWSQVGTLSIVSDSASDTGALLVQGLDSSFNEITETVSMLGLTPVTTSNAFARINYIHYSSSTNPNAGNISASRNGTVVGYITAGFGIGQMAQYTVPADHTAYVLQGIANIGKGNDGIGRFKYRPYGSSFQTALIFTMYQASFQYKFSVPIMLPEKTDIDVTLTASTASVASNCNYDMILIHNHL